MRWAASGGTPLPVSETSSGDAAGTLPGPGSNEARKAALPASVKADAARKRAGSTIPRVKTSGRDGAAEGSRSHDRAKKIAKKAAVAAVV